jgi:hypothetical protein
MDVLNIEETPETPKVILNQKDGIFEISGRSLPEDAVEFYTPLMEWLKNYGKSPNPSTAILFKLEYFNTASSKLILELLKVAKAIDGVKVVWCHFEDDEDVLEAGKEFADQVSIPFEYKAVNP